MSFMSGLFSAAGAKKAAMGIIQEPISNSMTRNTSLDSDIAKKTEEKKQAEFDKQASDAVLEKNKPTPLGTAELIAYGDKTQSGSGTKMLLGG